ncbi:KPN_02809 family neutral zinc metallopeptidase [Acinetobacter sp. ANC 4641]|uniref:KPN_02809 family neutral zinc metallopeptidase n=1 Tax=Acinetobacter sp. ANC 4641 TaxID=2529847 RepID=UPI00103F7565|nr:neutral zinc metallopeptidase [Acinetobacter sp. ANC 4641]TCB11559.1 neutral zinc metallopeptidase [Acinetobacter sp. ANC 4641]
MEWKGRRESDNVEDRRGSGAVKTGGISILGLLVAFVAWKFFGADPQQTYQVTKQLVTQQQSNQQAVQHPTSEQQEAKQFVSTILADTEDTWTTIFKQQGLQYTPTKLVLYRQSTPTACGAGQSAMGPFYCPSDKSVYLDTDFFVEMRQQLGISGEKNSTQLSRQDQAGDFAMAYVIAHEVGHHVQNLLGVSEKIYAQRQQMSQKQANQLSVRQELQADCFAGIWAKYNNQRTHFLQQGDVEEAMDAAEKIGDDYLQKRSSGQIVPDSFTHGTSQQRMKWFDRGLNAQDLSACDTFRHPLS